MASVCPVYESLPAGCIRDIVGESIPPPLTSSLVNYILTLDNKLDNNSINVSKKRHKQASDNNEFAVAIHLLLTVADAKT